MTDLKRNYDGVTAHPSSERQPLHENFNDHDGFDESTTIDPAEGEHVALTLIEHKEEKTSESDCRPPFTIDASFQNAIENPYKDTTINESHLARRVPSCDLVPKGWKNLNRVIIGSYVAIAFCFVTGLLALRFATRARKYQTKGLYGLVQRDTLRSVVLIYSSIIFGLAILIIVIAIAVS